MARKPRMHYFGAFYHVILRGNGGMSIFQDSIDRKKFLDLVQESIIRYEYRVHAFCLMTNHVHFALQVGNIPLSKIMQNISFRYTRFINKRQKRIGHLFQGRYKALLIDADCYLLQLVRYIHLNPMRANMVKKLVEYPWSSHLVYLGRVNNCWLTTTYVFDLLTHKEVGKKNAYQKYMERSQDSDINFDVSIQKSFPAICDDYFMKQLEEKQNHKQHNLCISLEKLVSLICDYYGIQETMLHERKQKRLPSKLRFITAKLAVEFRIATLTEVARYFSRDISIFSHKVNWVREIDSRNLDTIRHLIESAIVQA